MTIFFKWGIIIKQLYESGHSKGVSCKELCDGIARHESQTVWDIQHNFINYTQEYRSGHNEAVLKTVWVKAHGGSNPSSCAKNIKDEKNSSFMFCISNIKRDSRVGAVLQEQNALPRISQLPLVLTAKDAVDNGGAGRAATGETPSSCAKNAKTTRLALRVVFFHLLFCFIIRLWFDTKSPRKQFRQGRKTSP